MNLVQEAHNIGELIRGALPKSIRFVLLLSDQTGGMACVGTTDDLESTMREFLSEPQKPVDPTIGTEEWKQAKAGEWRKLLAQAEHERKAGNDRLAAKCEDVAARIETQLAKYDCRPDEV